MFCLGFAFDLIVATIPAGSFTLAWTPSPTTSLQVFRNGILQKQTLDYTLTGSAIQFVAGAIPQMGDVLLASYRIVPAGGTTPGVLCIGVGTSTNQSSSTSLGTCTIPAGTLRTGDRIEIRFDVSHDGGTSTGFQYQVLWGATQVASKTAAAVVTKATGLTSGGVNSSGTQWSTLVWGNNGLSLTGDAGNAAESAAASLTIDFRGQMSGATAETVTVRGYTVVRNPVP